MRGEDMTGFRYYNSTTISTMAGSTKEIQGITFVLHQEALPRDVSTGQSCRGEQ